MKYKKGKFPYTVYDTQTNALYVRRAVKTESGKQRQIWRVCRPQTAARVLEVLAEIEKEIYALEN